MAFQEYSPAQLQALFYERVGQNNVFWRAIEVGLILKEAFRVFNCLTGYWRGRISMGLTVASQPWYSTPPGLTYIYRVEINEVPLGSSSLWDLDYGQPQWESETCTAGNLPQVFAPMGTNLFALWPSSFAGGESLVVDGVIPAPDPTMGTFVNLGQEELTAILDYSEHLAQFKEGGQEFEASQLLLQKFLKYCASRNALLMQSARFRSWMGLTDEVKRPIRSVTERVGAR